MRQIFQAYVIHVQTGKWILNFILAHLRWHYWLGHDGKELSMKLMQVVRRYFLLRCKFVYA